MNIQKNENMGYLNAANTWVVCWDLISQNRCWNIFLRIVSLPFIPSRLLAIMTTRIFNPLYHSDLVFRLSKWFKLEKENSAITNGFVDDILQKKKVAYVQNKKNKTMLEEVNEDQNSSFKTPQLFIDQLLKLSMEGKYFTDTDVKNEANTIVATVIKFYSVFAIKSRF